MALIIAHVHLNLNRASAIKHASYYLPYGNICLIFQTTLEVFLEMEHMELISHTDLELLESIIQPVCPMLTEKINQFKAQHSKLQKILIANGTHKNEKCINEDTQPNTEIVQKSRSPGHCFSSASPFLSL